MLRLFKRRRPSKEERKSGPVSVSTPPRLRAPQATVSLDWLLGLTGELANDSPASVRFRENIESPNIKLAEIETWIRQSLVHPLEQQRLLALQDLVNSIGKRLGFGVTYGKYTKTADDWLQFDGLWRIETDLFATVDVYSLRIEGIDMTGLLQASERLSASNKLLEKSEVLHLFILCEDYDPAIEEEIRKSPLFGRIRLLPINTLFEMLRMFNDGVVSAGQLPFLFRSYDNIGIHNVILFLEQFIAGYQEPENSMLDGLSRAREIRKEADEITQRPPDFTDIVEMLEAGEAGAELLEEYVSANPEDDRAGEYYADLCAALGQADKALAAYTGILGRKPAHETVLLKVVDILKAKQQYKEALGFVERTLPNIPRTAIATRAELLLLDDRPDQCRVVCEETLSADPGRADLYKLMGRAFEKEGAVSEAIACLEKTCQMSPSDVDAKRRLAALKKKLTSA